MNQMNDSFSNPVPKASLRITLTLFSSRRLISFRAISAKRSSRSMPKLLPTYQHDPTAGPTLRLGRSQCLRRANHVQCRCGRIAIEPLAQVPELEPANVGVQSGCRQKHNLPIDNSCDILFTRSLARPACPHHNRSDARYADGASIRGPSNGSRKNAARLNGWV